MTQNLLKVVLVLLLFSLNAFARDWQSIKIPGAKCGNGSTYKVWIHKKADVSKLAIEFMGGGACWSQATCLGSKLRAWVFPLISIPALSVFSSERSYLSPAHDASMIYFPYCTGDVHVGTHIAQYGKHQIHHVGKQNIEKSFKYLKKYKIIEFDKVNELLVYGASAGALGALAHSEFIESLVPATATKTLIADSPGLHFGNKFWDKFGVKMFEDLKKGFNHLVPVKRGDGLMARHLPRVCQKLSNWNVGILQASQDLVMSQLFGDISPSEHEKLVYGEFGVTMKNTFINNCSSFVAKGPWHTFLVALPTAVLKVNGTSAIDYMFRVSNGRMDINYH